MTLYTCAQLRKNCISGARSQFIAMSRGGCKSLGGEARNRPLMGTPFGANRGSGVSKNHNERVCKYVGSLGSSAERELYFTGFCRMRWR